MKSSFTYDGDRVVIRLEVEDSTERAVAALLESLTESAVQIVRPAYASYGSDQIEAVVFTMRRPDA